MKIRNGWVGNSSSSSFIIVGKYPQELVDKHGTWWLEKLDGEYRERAINFAKSEINSGDEYRWFTNNDERKDLLDSNESVYLTTFIGECGDLFGEVCDLPNSFHIDEGNHGTPYDEDEYDEIREDEIWLRNEEKVEALEKEYIEMDCD